MLSGDFHIPFAESGSYPVRAGNRVRPLIDGEPAYGRICEAVEAAQHSVWLTVAWIWDYVPHAGRTRIVVRRARRGSGARSRRSRHFLPPHGRGAVPAQHHLRRNAGGAAVAREPRLEIPCALGFDAGLVVSPPEELDRRRRPRVRDRVRRRHEHEAVGARARAVMSAGTGRRRTTMPISNSPGPAPPMCTTISSSAGTRRASAHLDDGLFGHARGRYAAVAGAGVAAARRDRCAGAAYDPQRSLCRGRAGCCARRPTTSRPANFRSRSSMRAPSMPRDRRSTSRTRRSASRR